MTALANESPAYQMFEEVLRQKSQETAVTYKAVFWAYMKYRKMTHPEELLQGTAQEKEDAIKTYIKSMSHSMANKTVWALNMFFISNRDELNWPHIRLFMPRDKERVDKEPKVLRPYTHEEIKQIWNHADQRQLVATGIMGPGGGVRIGGLPSIKVKDLVRIEDHNLYAIAIYSYSKKENYWTFATPQVSKFIDEYMKDEHKGKSEYLFIDKHHAGWHVSKEALDSDIDRLMLKVGLRSKGEESETQTNHAFRKFFRTQLEISGVEDEAAARLMGHSAWLKKVYSMPEPEKLIEATQYPKAIANLTIPF